MKARTIKVTVLKAEPKPPLQVQIVVKPVMTPCVLEEVARVLNAPQRGAIPNRRTKAHEQWARLGVTHGIAADDFLGDPTPERWNAVVKAADALEAFLKV